MYLFRLLLVLLSINLTINKAAAAESDYLHCTKAINFYEERYKLPRNLLHSIATVESGKWNEKHKRILPWPWTLNVAGKAHYFATKQEAVNFLKSVLAKGIEQVDVGCAQINWYYHGKKHFKKPEHAFNPVFNTAYAAYFLSQNYERTKDWAKAVAIYHSRTEEKGKNYAAKVHKIWHNHRLGSKVGFDRKQKIEPKTYHRVIISRNLNNLDSDIIVRTSAKDSSVTMLP
ncbi:MAG: Transglycosylase-putative [Candidatus Midichloria mitochondrii]|uniref:Transglycosylase-putative n=1 Tax=Midichloria mitochondrii (strain IricVA) TaxID=696127 RepID=F7XUF9_MIDMI|nr:transglycosylase SLT domain-containing protein [Candidatus Midichloria mitochondrii]AEI89518.1 Transglycosylase-putative [Candidatus Midichloria mitochondrii IricVA]MDJ1256945.1 transglycosylase SLT domain-containing protein [Candidatus Midichloria mitochondrii]MDJ1288695.1 transglycosylase SLT domain-containing protein [Candidatus Midichloria mitochondrii]MDJ1299517.1 transglycosylase SLT domain-containing protein [Candidatus Midichloria mitochondrii]MDJ1313608.1 transglycosylase SLT domai